ncbi:MAG TPA: nuclear transport factor 2 family protein [Ilumatobacteraceae bacterium]
MRNAEELATDWWEGFATHDVDRLVGLFAADATFWDPRFPPFKGQDNIRLYYADLLGKTAQWGGVRSNVYVMDSSHFAVHTRTSFVLSIADKTIDFPMVGFFEHHDGLVTAYEEYWDTAYMLRQFGPGAAFPPPPAFAPSE